jgi:hypothetical protein
MDDQEIYHRAKRRVGQIKGFYVHATVYVLVNALLISINLLTQTPTQLRCSLLPLPAIIIATFGTKWLIRGTNETYL